MKNNRIKKGRENGWREIKSKRYFSNNIIALLVVLFMLISLFFNLIIYKNTETPVKLHKITGKATEATISLCIGGPPPYVTVIYPNGGEVINGIINVNATATAADEDEDTNLTFHYADFSKFIGIDTDESDIYYNHSWDTIVIDDGNCNYKIFVRGYSNKSICGGISGSDGSDSYFSINNVDVEPTWNNFKNNLTTNFSEFENLLELGDWTAIENASIGIPDKGLINFSGQTINFDDADLDSHTNISYNYLSIDTSLDALPCLSRSAILTLYNISFTQPKILADGEDCSGPQRNLTTCTIIDYSNKNLIFSVTNFLYDYSAAENSSVRLEIWDQTDNITIYINQNVTFFANFSDNVYNNPINGTSVYCNIKFNLTGSYTPPVDMDFNHISLLYEYNESFSSPGTFEYIVFCNDSHYNFGTISKSDNFTITNREPILISIMPNETWNEDTILTGRDLDDYFMDPDGETLIFTSTKVPNIDVSIDNITHVVTYTPQANFYGNRTVKFYAYDPHDAMTESNVIYLFVIDVPEPVSIPPSGGGGGGTRIICEELWECTKWGKCLPSGIQIRTCVDLAECGTEFRKPFESRSCEYIGTCSDLIKNCHHGLCEEKVDCGGPCTPCPTCFDGIQNQGEEGIDCGGPCPVCKTCFDGIQNQGEEGIDCGGPCPPCPSCSDGIKNCHHGLCEEKTDCGGPCPACKKIEIPVAFKKAIWPTILLLGMLVLTIILVIVRFHKYYQPFITRILMKFIPLIGLFKKKKKEMPEELKEKESILLRLDKLEKSIDKKSIDELSKEFVRIVRDFLSDLLKIEYEFTYEEFCKEIEKHKISTPLRIILVTFFKKISEISYKGYKMDKSELREMVKEARIIVKLGSEEYLEGKTEKEEPKKTEQKKKQNIKKESKLMLEVYKDLIKAKKSIRESDIDSAKLAYIRIKEIYEELPVKDKRKIYKKIVWLYNKIKEVALDKVKIN